MVVGLESLYMMCLCVPSGLFEESSIMVDLYIICSEKGLLGLSLNGAWDCGVVG